MHKFTTSAPYELTKLADGSWKAKLKDSRQFVIGVSRSDAIAKADALNDRINQWFLRNPDISDSPARSLVNDAKLGSAGAAKELIRILHFCLEYRKIPRKPILNWFTDRLQRILDDEDASTALGLKLGRGQRNFEEAKKRRSRDREIAMFIAFRIKKISLEDSAKSDGLFTLAATTFKTTKEVARKAWKRNGKSSTAFVQKLSKREMKNNFRTINS